MSPRVSFWFLEVESGAQEGVLRAGLSLMSKGKASRRMETETLRMQKRRGSGKRRERERKTLLYFGVNYVTLSSFE